MDKQMYEDFFNDEEQEFTGEEITTFKRYIEENNVCNDNNFELLEENLNFYSSRYTSEVFKSPAELFQANSNYRESDEMGKNVELYFQSVEWASKTVHPEDSEYVIKKEKYIFNNELEGFIKDIIEHLNKYPKEDYQCMDILIYQNGNILKYLPHKNFVFTWRIDCNIIINKLLENNFFQSLKIFKEEEYYSSLIILPIFIPIRKSLFLGEYGYRSAMVDYGRIVERIGSFLEKNGEYNNLERFDNLDVNKLIGLDGIEKSIFNILIYK